jgi:hypothetical protein
MKTRLVYAVIPPFHHSSEYSCCCDIYAWYDARRYENIGGYTLGADNTATFYDSLDTAKSKLRYLYNSAIIEIEMNDEGFLDLKNFITYNGTRDLMQKSKQFPGLFEPVKVNVFNTREILAREISPRALEELERQFKLSIPKTMKYEPVNDNDHLVAVRSRRNKQ